METKVSKEEAKKALEEAFETEDMSAMFFWTGYLLGLS